jgi:hypothetical protein
MRRTFIAALVVAAAALLSAGTALGAPSNKNAESIQATCDGTTFTVLNNDRANVNAVFHVVGRGPGKLISIQAYEPGTTNLIFEDQSNFPKEPNATCTGTISGTDPDTGEQFTFDFVVQAYLR